MTKPECIKIVGFSDNPISKTERRLPADRVLTGAPEHSIRSMFETQDGELTAGTWTSTPGKWIAFQDRDEFCYITNGHVRLTDDEGLAREFKTGDAFLIPNGFKGTWEVLETTTKHYVIRHYK